MNESPEAEPMFSSLPTLEQARAFLAMGLSVIPIPRGRKKPIIKWAEYQKRKPTEAELVSWFGNGHAPQNIAIITGAVSGLIVVDADGTEAEGFIQAELPATPRRTKTAKGRHHFYRHPGTRIRNKARVKVNGCVLPLDVRADGGYVIAPGSQHPSGYIYQFEGDWKIPTSKLPTLNPSIFVAPDPQKSEPLPQPNADLADTVSRARAYLAKVPPAIEGQGGDAHTLSAACRIVRGFDLSEEIAVCLLLEWNQTCLPPWTEREIREKVGNALKYGTEPIGHLRDAERPSASSSDEDYLQAEREAIQNEESLAEEYYPIEAGPELPDTAHWRLYDAGKSENWPDESLVWHIEGLIPKGGIGFMSAPPKDRKSLLTLDMALHLAQAESRSWLGKFNVTPAKILYIAREDPLRRIKGRMAEICRSYDMPLPSPGKLAFLVRERIHLNDVCHREWLKRTIRESGFDFLILDVINRMHPDLDEISSKDMGQLVAILEELNRELGVTILSDDHTRKPQGRNTRRDSQEPNPFDMKGSMAKYGCADFMICLSRTPMPSRMQFYAENKDSDERPSFFIDVSPKGSTERKFTYAGEVERMAADMKKLGEENREKVFEALSAEAWSSPKEIAKKTGLSVATVTRHLGKLLEAGRAVRRGESRNIQYRRAFASNENTPEANRDKSLFGND